MNLLYCSGLFVLFFFCNAYSMQSDDRSSELICLIQKVYTDNYTKEEIDSAQEYLDYFLKSPDEKRAHITTSMMSYKFAAICASIYRQVDAEQLQILIQACEEHALLGSLAYQHFTDSISTANNVKHFFATFLPINSSESDRYFLMYEQFNVNFYDLITRETNCFYSTKYDASKETDKFELSAYKDPKSYEEKEGNLVKENIKLRANIGRRDSALTSRYMQENDSTIGEGIPPLFKKIMKKLIKKSREKFTGKNILQYETFVYDDVFKKVCAVFREYIVQYNADGDCHDYVQYRLLVWDMNINKVENLRSLRYPKKSVLRGVYFIGSGNKLLVITNDEYSIVDYSSGRDCLNKKRDKMVISPNSYFIVHKKGKNFTIIHIANWQTLASIPHRYKPSDEWSVIEKTHFFYDKQTGILDHILLDCKEDSVRCDLEMQEDFLNTLSPQDAPKLYYQMKGFGLN